MKKIVFSLAAFVIFFMIIFTSFKCGTEKKELSHDEMIARGKYLVVFGGCNDCHTPKIYTEMGPVPDTTRLLSGFQEGEMLPEIDVNMVQPGKWVTTEKNFTGWVGPWGISYAANLTPDNETGIGVLTEELFIKTLREGKYMGTGRNLLPPMPWPGMSQLSDEDLKAIYAYLRSIPPIKNKVPDPVPLDMVAMKK